MKYLCSICALAEADTITAIEGFTGVVRARPVCWPCCSPVPGPAEEYEPVDLADRYSPAESGRRWMFRHAPRDERGKPIAGARAPSTLAVYEAVRKLGAATTGEIAAALGVAVAKDSAPREERRPYDALTSCLRNAIARGDLVGEWRMPGSPSAGRIYRVPARAA